MAKNLLTECPYCHRKVGLIGASVLKNKGEHCCRGCKCISNVVISRVLYALASIATVGSLLILVLYSAFGDHSDIRGVLYVFLPFLIFYLLVPFFVKLEPCADKSAVKKLQRKHDPIPEVDVPVRQEHPIELNVSDGFSTSFFNAKKSVKTEEPSYPAVTAPEEKTDISSGIDIDISAQTQQEQGDTIVFQKGKASSAASEDGAEKVVFNENREEETVSFLSGTPSQSSGASEMRTPEPVEENGGEVSFLIGRHDE